MMWGGRIEHGVVAWENDYGQRTRIEDGGDAHDGFGGFPPRGVVRLRNLPHDVVGHA